ncbi:MAG: O-antigen/teichoic acid export membrane protein [Paraglaciecola sp.]
MIMTVIKPTGRKQTAKNISIYAVGTIVRQLAAFIMLPVYTSYLSPADYGIVALLVLMLALFELVLGARFTQAVPKFYYEKKQERERKEVITTSLVLTAAVSLLSVSVIFYFSESIARLAFDSAHYSWHVQLYCIVLLTAALEGYGLTYFRIQEKPILFVVNSIAKLVVQLSLNIYFVVYLELGVIGVVYSAVISSVAFGLFAVGYILRCNGVWFNKALVKRFVQFSWPLWLAGLAGLYVGSSSQAYIKFFSDLSNVGLFELGNKFAAMLGILVWAPFSQWWQTERFKIYQSADKGVAVFPVVFNAMAIVLVFAGLGITLFGEVVIRLMADAAFHTASLAIPFLVLAAVFRELTNFFKFSFLVTENTLFMAYIGYGAAGSLTIFLILLVPNYGFTGAAIAIMLNNIIVFLISSHYSKKHFDNHIVFNLFAKLLVVLILLIFGDYWFSKLDLPMNWNLQVKFGLVLLYIFFLSGIIWQDKMLKEFFSDLFRYLKGRYSKKQADRE